MAWIAAKGLWLLLASGRGQMSAPPVTEGVADDTAGGDEHMLKRLITCCGYGGVIAHPYCTLVYVRVRGAGNLVAV